jgi:hypothetical protein
LAKKGVCESGRPRLEEFKFDGGLTEEDCIRLTTPEIRNEIIVCEKLKEIGLHAGSILNLKWNDLEDAEKTRIQGFEGEMVKLTPLLWNYGKRQRKRWAFMIYNVFYPDTPIRRSALQNGEKYGEFGWHSRHDPPTINIPYKIIIEHTKKEIAREAEFKKYRMYRQIKKSLDDEKTGGGKRYKIIRKKKSRRKRKSRSKKSRRERKSRSKKSRRERKSRSKKSRHL